MGHSAEPACRPNEVAENVPDSVVRARLAAAIAELGAAAAGLSNAQESASRLAAIITEASRLDADLATLRAEEEQELGGWLAAGGNGPRPARAPAITAAEERRAGLAVDAAAGRAGLPAAEAAFQRCAAKVAAAQRRRDEAACAAAAEAARDFAREYRATLIAALHREAVLHGLRAELLRCGNRADALPGALAAAAQVGEIIAATKRGASVHHAPGAGQRLLAALNTDPNAQLRMDSQP